MNYTVCWQPECSDELAEIWMASDDRAAVSQAADEIDHLLGSNPQKSGTPLHEGLWAIAVPPLKAAFTVRESDKIVEVQRVARI